MVDMENAGKASKTVSTIAILWPVKAIFKERAATLEVDTSIFPGLKTGPKGERRLGVFRMGAPESAQNSKCGSIQTQHDFPHLLCEREIIFSSPFENGRSSLKCSISSKKSQIIFEMIFLMALLCGPPRGLLPGGVGLQPLSSLSLLLPPTVAT